MPPTFFATELFLSCPECIFTSQNQVTSKKFIFFTPLKFISVKETVKLLKTKISLKKNPIRIPAQCSSILCSINLQNAVITEGQLSYEKINKPKIARCRFYHLHRTPSCTPNLKSVSVDFVSVLGAHVRPSLIINRIILEAVVVQY